MLLYFVQIDENCAFESVLTHFLSDFTKPLMKETLYIVFVIVAQSF